MLFHSVEGSAVYTFVLSMDPFLASVDAVMITGSSERERPGSQTDDKIVFSIL